MIVHIDCNNFFASCELATRPDLQGKPAVVANVTEAGGGIILALNNEAKAVGLKRGNPIFQVKNLLKAKQVTVGCQSVSLDESWQQGTENMYLLGDNALLTLTEITRPDLFKDSPDQFLSILIRKLSEGSSTSYVLWQERKFNRGDDSARLDSIFWEPTEGNVTRDFKRLTKLSSGGYALLSLTVFDGVYSKKKSYFDSIIGSLTVKE